MHYFTGTIFGWTLLNNRVHGRMQHHAREELNGKQCQTSPVIVIMMEGEYRVAKTESGSVYALID